jgi:uncharacterized membrane protein YeiH
VPPHFTAVGGGLVRDVQLGVVRPSSLRATVAIVGRDGMGFFVLARCRRRHRTEPLDIYADFVQLRRVAGCAL